jgi:integrase
MLAQGERWNLIPNNVARKARPPAVHTEQISAPDAEQVRAILTEAEKVEPMLAALLALAAVTGARRGELCALRWTDVDWQAVTLTIARSIYETKGGGWGEKPTKTHQARRVGLDDFGLTVLRRHHAEVHKLATDLRLDIPGNAFMFSRSPQGTEPIHPDVVTKFAARASKAAGVDTHMHALRHFTATQAIGAGYDARTVASRLGHADPSITLRVYSHAIEQRDHELAATLGSTLAPPSSDSSELPPAKQQSRPSERSGKAEKQTTSAV